MVYLESSTSTSPVSLVDLLSNDIVLRTITPYLPLPSLSSLASTCSTLNSYLLHTPGSIHYLDLTGLSSRTVARALSLPAFKSGLRTVYLDLSFVDDSTLTDLFLDFKLRHLSLSGSYGWTLDRLCEIIDTYYISSAGCCVAAELAARTSAAVSATGLKISSTASSSSLEYDFTATSATANVAAHSFDTCGSPSSPCLRKRPTIHSLELLGAPTFPTNIISSTAPLFATLAERAGIKTDLAPCEAHSSLDPDDLHSHVANGWHLALHSSRKCSSCGLSEEKLCLGCMILRSCRGCNRFWCSKCDPAASHATIDCYDCGPTCEDCKVGVVAFCNFCKAKYCRVHQESSTELYCDWCSSRGGRTRYNYY
ncbi:uncharacterized protein V1516DRAFT_624615 [Lipomyces oligophaga]|uniref:uncharacterized protein n=1 Tax=Lipomyces oligophaga TaxID=45792 RepID=UPI0034CFFDC6